MSDWLTDQGSPRTPNGVNKQNNATAFAGEGFGLGTVLAD